MPWRITSIEEQVALELEHLRRKGDELEKYIGLAALQNRNETLFYRLLVDHLEELAPIIYTPTVGRACREYSHVLRRPRGVWITPDDIDHIPELLRNAGQPGVRLIVVTDNERILGLGDQGAGRHGHPDRQAGALRRGSRPPPAADPAGLARLRDRQRGAAARPSVPRLSEAATCAATRTYAFIDAFVGAVKSVYPDALVQWEDFKQHNAIRLLDHYRHRLPCFNDDIQGTAAVVCAGILAALRHTGEKLVGTRLVLLGSGAAGIGIARLVQSIIRAEGATEDEARHAVTMLDSQGLLFEGRDGVQDDKRPFALTGDDLSSLGFEPSDRLRPRDRRPSRCAHDPDRDERQARRLHRDCRARDGARDTEAHRSATFQPDSELRSHARRRARVERWPRDRRDGEPFRPGRARRAHSSRGSGEQRLRVPRRGARSGCRPSLGGDRPHVPRRGHDAGGPRPARADRTGGDLPEHHRSTVHLQAIALAVAHEARDGKVAPMATDAELEAAVDACIWAPQYGCLEPTVAAE